MGFSQKLLDRWRELALLAGLFGLGLAVRLPGLGAYGLWTDETFTRHLAMQPLWAILTAQDQTPPLHAVLEHIWIAIGGTGVVWLRTPSLLFGAAVAPMTYLVARDLMRRWSAVSAAVLVGCSVFLVSSSQEARGYSLLVFLSVASFWTLGQLEKAWSTKRAVWHGLVAVALAYSHVYGLLFLLAQNVYVLSGLSNVQFWSRRWFALQLAVALCFAPWLPIFFRGVLNVAGSSWILPPSAYELFRTYHLLTGGRVLGYLLVPLAAAGALWPLRKLNYPSKRSDLQAGGKILAWFVVPLAVPIALSYVSPVFAFRYALPSIVPFVLLCVYGANQLFGGRESIHKVALVTLLGASLITVVAFHATGEPEDSRQDWLGAAALLATEAKPGSVLLFNQGSCDSATDLDTACAYDLISTRQDLRQVAIFLEDRGHFEPLNETSVKKVDAVVSGAPEVWIIYSYDNDVDLLIPKRLAELGWTGAGTWHVKNIELLQFEPPAANPPARVVTTA